jgi:hypothetical protein
MTLLIHQSDKSKAILVAKNEDDAKCLRLLYDNHVVFGLWKLWLDNPEGKGRDNEAIKQLLTAFPDMKGVAWLNLVRGFIPSEEFTFLGG